MTFLDAFDALGGLGLFLFSMRFLSFALNRTIARRLKGWMESAFASPLRALLCGLVSTALWQASSVTIIALMGLLATSLVNLEQAYYAMLGATIGTTVKAWFFAYDFERWGGLLIGLSSVALVVVRRPLWREALEIVLALGFTFFGLQLLAAGLAPVGHQTVFVTWLQTFNAPTLWTQFLAALAGCILAMTVQSSSSVIFLVIFLAGQQAITFTGGASLILGANVGTTLTPVLASFEFDANVRRLAFAHVLVKALGVVITLFFFPYFLAIVNLLMTACGAVGEAPRLAAVHTLFNLLAALTFGLLGGFMLKLMGRLVPEASVPSTTALPAVVRKMLTRSPQRALEEADRQLKAIDGQTKALIDACFQLMFEGTAAYPKRAEEARFRRDFEALREAVHDLLLRLGRRQLRPDQRERMHATLQMLGRFQDVQAQGLALLNTLTLGVGDRGYTFPASMSELLASFQSAFDSIWLRVHFRQALDPRDAEALPRASERLDRFFFAHVLEDVSLPPDQEWWTYDAITRMRVMGEMLVALAGVISGQAEGEVEPTEGGVEAGGVGREMDGDTAAAS